jgi:hypothetical protein
MDVILHVEASTGVFVGIELVARYDKYIEVVQNVEGS